MSLPPLYKYLDARGAKLTLGNRTFRHAKPSDFNDVEDLTIQSLFPEETEEALRTLAGGFTDVILRNIDKEPTCNSPQKEMLVAIQQALRTKPDLAELARTEMVNKFEQTYDVDFYRERANGYIAEINEFLQGYRVLCATTHKDSERMWTEYADEHKGVCLRIAPNLAKDSKFQLFRPVTYRDKRPPLYEDALEFCAGALFGDLEARVKECVERIIYTKTLKWQHESEYRLVCPVAENEQPWSTMPYHPEEITELYLGLAMDKDDAEDIVDKARTVNRRIRVYRGKRNGAGKIIF